MTSPGATVCIACGIFRQELEALRDRGEIGLPWSIMRVPLDHLLESILAAAKLLEGK